VEISTTLSTDLKNLLLVLNMPELELERSLGSLQRDVQQAVSSFVGLSISVVVSGQLVTLTSVDEGEVESIASSLAVPIVLTAANDSSSELVLYASNPGAFVDMAADLSYALAPASGKIRLDEHLHPDVTESGLAGVEELAMVNRAQGVLIGRGLTPEGAQDHLDRKARQSGLQVFQVAAYLLSTME
jgi:hypothetical protein